MICKGGKRSGGASLANHLLKDDNERIVVVEITGTATQDLTQALKDMELTAKMTKAKTGLYHAQINPAMGETMTPQQWQYSVDEMEKRLGLNDQPRAVVYHEKGGRAHIHVVWQRTDIEQGKVIDTKNDYYIHKKLGRDLEKRFKHKQLKAEFGSNWDTMNERQQTIRDGYTPKQLKARVKKLYQQHSNPKELQQALKKAGFDLAIGRRGVVLVSDKNQVHSLMRFTGEKKKHVEEKLQPILKQLPKVEDLKKDQTQLKEKKTEQKRDQQYKKKVMVENAFDMVTKDEIGQASARFDKLIQDFKEERWEKKKSEFNDNDDGITRARTIDDAFSQVKKILDIQEDKERENQVQDKDRER
ncbi:relaxase/mobilization nuclease domain-containing protein [uncultured Kordia sp.]|uniref:relaxase/mobilization nuclease domain-containing protein n=1 Tax=uncultured Kordia sp. TaxID=507699 RepID=UPI00260C53C1|nr:relaxase/mobilization nuclease domain-containing protein [uncultured Kordia sp.]